MTKVPWIVSLEEQFCAIRLCAASYGVMESRSNTELLAIRFAPYIQELREFFKSRGLRFGSPEDIVPLAFGLGSPGSFHDEMTSMIRSIVFRERGVVPRNELLQMILIAIGGVEIDHAAQEVVGPVVAVYEFVGEVIHSLKRQTFVEEDEAADAAAASLAEPLAGREFAAGTAWAFDPDAEEPAEPHPLGGAFARAQAISPHFEEPGTGWEVGSLPPKPVRPRILEGTELAGLQRVPAPLPPPSPRQHFFRNMMFALCIALAAAVAWRHQYPIRSTEAKREISLGGAAGPADVVASSLAGQRANAPGNSLQDVSRTGVGASSGGPLAGPAKARSSGAAKQEENVPGSRVSGTAVAGAQARPTVSAPAAGSGGAGSKVAPPAVARRRAPRPAPASVAGAGVVAAPAIGKQGAFLVSSGVMDGNLIAAPTPKYPRMASMAGIEGQVILQAVVSKNGTVVAAHVLEGHHLLRGAAVHAVRGWRYRPYMVQGKATDVATIVIVDFHLPH